MLGKMIVMFEEEVAVIKNDHRRKWKKVESPEEPDWLPPPPRHWLDPTRSRGIVIIGVITDQFRRRSCLKTDWLPWDSTGCSGA